jgi:hypothetical protein
MIRESGEGREGGKVREGGTIRWDGKAESEDDKEV